MADNWKNYGGGRGSGGGGGGRRGGVRGGNQQNQYARQGGENYYQGGRRRGGIGGGYESTTIMVPEAVDVAAVAVVREVVITSTGMFRIKGIEEVSTTKAVVEEGVMIVTVTSNNFREVTTGFPCVQFPSNSTT